MTTPKWIMIVWAPFALHLSDPHILQAKCALWGPFLPTGLVRIAVFSLGLFNSESQVIEEFLKAHPLYEIFWPFAVIIRILSICLNHIIHTLTKISVNVNANVISAGCVRSDFEVITQKAVGVLRWHLIIAIHHFFVLTIDTVSSSIPIMTAKAVQCQSTQCKSTYNNQSSQQFLRHFTSSNIIKLQLNSKIVSNKILMLYLIYFLSINLSSSKRTKRLLCFFFLLEFSDKVC